MRAVSKVVPNGLLSPGLARAGQMEHRRIDPDGNLGYDHLVANASSVILTDQVATRIQYNWSNSNYKPPVNEDGVVRNNDSSFAD